MPEYAFRCISGHRFDLSLSPDRAGSTPTCPSCGRISTREYVVHLPRPLQHDATQATTRATGKRHENVSAEPPGAAVVVEAGGRNNTLHLRAENVGAGLVMREGSEIDVPYARISQTPIAIFNDGGDLRIEHLEID